MEVSWIQFSKYLPGTKDAKILDAGCGGGGWALRLALMRYKKLTLVDISKSNIQGTKNNFKEYNVIKNAEFIHTNIESLDMLESNTFDFILCERDPLEYCFKNQDKAFSELIRLLKKKGIITLSMGTGYKIKQQLLALKMYNDFFNFENTGIKKSEECPVRPGSVKRIKELFQKNNIKKLEIAGRLTITDLIPEENWQEIYKNSELKKKLLDMEIDYQKKEEHADSSSHIFAAGKK